MQSEIFTTLLVFLTSANREIVKSTLGYIKLSIHTLPTDLLQPHLKDLVPALLRWSHDHKNHFKAKVRHIFERMLRRFGWTDVYSCAGEEEAAKVLVNIKKRKERAKRKKNARGEEEDEDEVSVFAARLESIWSFRSVLQNPPLVMLSRTFCTEAKASWTTAMTKSRRQDVQMPLPNARALTMGQGYVSMTMSLWIFFKVPHPVSRVGVVSFLNVYNSDLRNIHDQVRNQIGVVSQARTPLVLRPKKIPAK